MLRRRLLTDPQGLAHVTEGTVTTDGRVLSPILICTHGYESYTVYPLNDSWKDVWNAAIVGRCRNGGPFKLAEGGYVNLIDTLSFYEYLQYHYEMYSFGELSSRTIFMGMELLEGG